jgi:site-specific recombinase XerD
MSTTHPTRAQGSRRDRAHRRKYPLEPLLLADVALLLSECRPQKPGPTYEIMAARLRAAIVVLYRTGMRVSELADLTERDLDPTQGTILIRHGKGDRSRLVGMDAWGWDELDRWLTIRHHIAPGYLLPVVMGATAGAKWWDSDLRRQMREAGRRAGLGKRCHPHALRHGWTIENHREGLDLLSIQAQLGHADLSITQIYLAGINPMERLAPVIARRAPMIELPHGQ